METCTSFEKYLAEKKAATPAPAVGQVWYSSWGYDQTNIDFYEVVKVTGSFVTLAPIAAESSPEQGFMTATKWPAKDADGKYIPRAYDPKPIKRKFRETSSGFYASLNSYSGAQPWDGEPMRYSWYA